MFDCHHGRQLLAGPMLDARNHPQNRPFFNPKPAPKPRLFLPRIPPLVRRPSKLSEASAADIGRSRALSYYVPAAPAFACDRKRKVDVIGCDLWADPAERARRMLIRIALTDMKNQ